MRIKYRIEINRGGGELTGEIEIYDGADNIEIEDAIMEDARDFLSVTWQKVP